MMRTIKFRAWHKTTHWMRPVAGISLADGFVSVYMEKDSPMRGPYLTVTLDEIELMQFTGLVDRNGKEVYEGDVYRNLDNGLIGKFYYLNGPGGYALHCRENNADGSPYNMLPFAQLDTTNFEVIGNIYENQELLEVNHAQS